VNKTPFNRVYNLPADSQVNCGSELCLSLENKKVIIRRERTVNLTSINHNQTDVGMYKRQHYGNIKTNRDAVPFYNDFTKYLYLPTINNHC